MKIYNVGFIVENDSSDLSKIKIVSTISFYEIDFDAYGINFEDKYNIDNLCFEIRDKDILKILTEPLFFVDAIHTIIYEQIEDEHGNLYAKELLTGLLFPLAIDVNSHTNYLYDSNGYNRQIKQIQTYEYDTMAKTKYVVVSNQIASKNMIDEYKRKILLRGKIKKLYNENVFQKEIVEKKEKTLEKQNEYTKLMEDIELLLQLLKKQNIKLYSKLIEEYKTIKNGKEDTLVAIEPNIGDLKKLISKIKLQFTIEKDFEDLPSYLSNTIESYYLKIITNEIDNTHLTIEYLDNITELFLISKEDYELKLQRDILKEISMLYLFVVKSNIENINLSKLNNSYFKDNLKTILLNILALGDTKIIKNDPNIKFDDNITVENIFNIIKEIEFDKPNKDKIKNLIN